MSGKLNFNYLNNDYLNKLNNPLLSFGGTDGQKCFNDIWRFDTETKAWTELSCIGHFPVPRERHAAISVGDVIYVFGGKSQENEELGDLVAFRIASMGSNQLVVHYYYFFFFIF